MGADQNIYIGPYLKVLKKNIKQLEKDQTVTVTTCTNKSCEIHGKKSVGKFCSSCGSPNGPVKVTNKIKIIPNGYDLLIKFGNEDLMSVLGNDKDDKEMIFLTNRRNNYTITLSSDTSYMEKPIPNSTEALESFTRDYQAFLSFLDSEEIVYQKMFGVISYWW